MHPVTFYGLECWHKKAFEKLGWMVLASKHSVENKDYADKIKMYMKELKHLSAALNEKINNVQEIDRKADLQILLSQVVILSTFAASTLGENMMVGGAKRKMSRKGSKKVSRK